jgi:hypothetical protein
MTDVQRAPDLLKEQTLPMSRFHVNSDLAAGPPAEVLAEIDLAWERARELFESGSGLYFEVGCDGVWAELQHADGSTERLTARQALVVCCAA